MPSVNLFRPRDKHLKGMRRLIFLVVGLWLLLVFGFQILLVLVQRDSSGSSFLTDTPFLGFPFHYWFTGQFTIVGFLLLCLLFNRLYDRSTSRIKVESEQEEVDDGNS